MRTERRIWLGVAIMAAIGLGMRLWHVFAEPLWLDEAYSAFAADHDFAFLWRVVPRYETHPPFYYSLMRLWVLAVGDGMPALRLPGVMAGIATPPLVALAAWRAGRLLDWTDGRRRWLMLAAFALACASIPLVEMTRQVRPYPLMIFVYAAALVLLLRLAERSAAGKPIAGRAFAAFLLLEEALLWLHNMGPLYGVALTLALAIAVLRRGLTTRDWAWVALGHLLAVAAYLPGLLILVGQAPTWVASTWVRFSFEALFGHLQMLYAGPGLPALAAIGLVVMAVAACAGASLGRRLVALLLVLTTMPVLLSVALSVTVAPVFITRTMTPVAVPALLLFAIGATAWADWRRLIGAGGVLMLLLSMGIVDAQARMAGPTEDWYGTVAWLRARFRPGDQVFAYPNEGALPLSYALRDRGLPYPIRSIPAPVPAFADYGGWYPTGSRGVVSLPPARLRAIAEEPATRAVPTIWLLRLGKEQYDRGDVLLRELHRGRHVVRSWRAGSIEVVGLAQGPARSR